MTRSLGRTALLLLLLLAGCASLLSLPEVLGGQNHADLVRTEQQPEERLKALQAMPAPDRAAMQAAEVAQLGAAPLNTTAISNLALLYSLDGGDAEAQKKAEALIVAASRRTLRNALVQLRTVNVHIGKRRYDEALFHLDGLLRSRPAFAPQIMDMMAASLLNDAGVESLARKLAENPPWRMPFLKHLQGSQTGVGGLGQVLQKLKKLENTNHSEETRLLIDKLVEQKNFDAAYFSWLDGLSFNDLKLVGNLFDGDFAREPQNLSFDWNLHSGPDAVISLATKPSQATDRYLRVQFNDNRTLFYNVWQYLKLAPGSYRLTGQALARNLKTDGGFVWQVVCMGEAGEVARTQPFLTTQEWRAFSMDFAVPPENCQTQLLRLLSASGATLDIIASGELGFDSLSVQAVE